MSKELRIILLSLLGLFIIIQFIPSDRPVNEPQSGYDFFQANQVPEEIEELFRNACYDCHSQEVNYPWYSYVAPVKWLIDKDVRDGRKNLDFSNWNMLEKKDKLHLLGEIEDEVEMGSMPLPIYVVMHSGAKLSDEDRETILDWTDEFAEQVFIE